VIVDIKIHHVGREGQGVGFDGDNNIYFVRGALPGDTVRVSCEETKRYRNAELVDILQPSSERRDPICPYFGQCGGCDWLNWSYEAQLRAKSEMVAHVLARAELKPAKLLPILPSPNPLGYRNRVQLHRGTNGVGFHRRGSNDLVEIELCRIAHPAINAKISELEKHSGNWKRVELALGSEGGVTVAFDEPEGEFSQVNDALNERLQTLVAGAIAESGGKTVLELYCGNGNLTQAYAPAVDTVVGVDSNPATLARAQARFAGQPHIRFLVEGVNGKLGRKLPAEIKDRYDTLVLDPPRPGVGKSLQNFLHGKLKTVIYVSCSPVTFSQDARGLVEQGMALQTVQPLDMFPQTRHVELFAVFSRS